MQELITPAQSRKLHTLLSHLGLMDEKKQMIANFTNNRTTSSRQLTRKEAAILIDGMDKEDPARKMIKKIYAICHSLGWIDNARKPEEYHINTAIIDLFLKRKGVKKKRLRDYTYSELPELVNQFVMIERHCRQQEERKSFQNEIDSILMELGIEKSQNVKI